MEIYEFPDECVQSDASIEEFCEELEVYFVDAFSVECLTTIDDMWDCGSRTFKLSFKTEGEVSKLLLL